MKMGTMDKRVISAFINEKKGESSKLKTDGSRLDGLWVEGNGIAYWEEGKIVMGDLGDKAVRKVQGAIREEAPRGKLAEGVENANRVLSSAVDAVSKR